MGTLNARARLAGGAVLAMIATGLGSSPASAQEGTSGPLAAATGQVPDDQLTEITVTARKREENPQNVPIPITVIQAEDLTRENLVNFTDFQAKFPAFSVYLTNPKQLNIGVRGIGNNGFNTDGIDGSVGVFVDGVYTGRLGMASTDFNDLEQVTLLRGPQGTLFGKNTTAGALIVNSRQPTFTPELLAEVSGGDESFRQVKVSVSDALVEDKVAARFSGYYSERDGNYPNLHGGEPGNAREVTGARLQLLLKPVDDVSVRLIAAHGEQDFNTLTPVTIGVYNPAALQARMAAAGYTLTVSNADRRELNIDAQQSATTHLNMLSGQVDWSLHDFGTVTAITGYQTWDCHTFNDNDYTQLDALPDYGSCNQEHQFSQEVRWATPQDFPVDAVTGAYYSYQHLSVDSRVRFGSQYYIWAANPSTTAFPNQGTRTWANGLYTGQVTGAGFISHAFFETETEALFGNLTWKPDFLPDLAFTAGLRGTFEQRDYNYAGALASNPGNLSATQLNALSPSGANAQLGRATDSLKDNSLSGQAGLTYRVLPDVMTYLTYSRGHKSAGFNLLPENSSNPDSGVASAIALGAKQDIKGEVTDNVELGIKSEWLDRRLLVNLTVFDTLVHNYQANESIGVGNTATKFLANVGALRSEGVELEAEAEPVRGLHLKGFIGYDRAYYASFRNSVCPAEYTALTCDLTGRQVAWAPRWTSDATIDYTHRITDDVKAYGLIDVNWRSKQNTTITLDPLASIQSYALVNLRVGTLLRDDTVDLQFWVENLTDKSYYINLLGLTKSTGIVQGYPGNPRTFGVTARLHI